MTDTHYCPHTPGEIREMLAVIGAGDVEELFALIPPELRAKTFNLPCGMSEFEAFGVECQDIDNKIMCQHIANKVL